VAVCVVSNASFQCDLPFVVLFYCSTHKHIHTHTSHSHSFTQHICTHATVLLTAATTTFIHTTHSHTRNSPIDGSNDHASVTPGAVPVSEGPTAYPVFSNRQVGVAQSCSFVVGFVFYSYCIVFVCLYVPVSEGRGTHSISCVLEPPGRLNHIRSLLSIITRLPLLSNTHSHCLCYQTPTRIAFAIKHSLALPLLSNTHYLLLP
jgi:hypothetical protein